MIEEDNKGWDDVYNEFMTHPADLGPIPDSRKDFEFTFAQPQLGTSAVKDTQDWDLRVIEIEKKRLKDLEDFNRNHPDRANPSNDPDAYHLSNITNFRHVGEVVRKAQWGQKGRNGRWEEIPLEWIPVGHQNDGNVRCARTNGTNRI